MTDAEFIKLTAKYEKETLHREAQLVLSTWIVEVLKRLREEDDEPVD
jgi:hypothetical protein